MTARALPSGPVLGFVHGEGAAACRRPLQPPLWSVLADSLAPSASTVAGPICATGVSGPSDELLMAGGQQADVNLRILRTAGGSVDGV